jgi:hypothetical protein
MPVGTMYVIGEGILRDRTITNNDSVAASLSICYPLVLLITNSIGHK